MATWTSERTERLRELWQRGWSATQIAEDLGGVSRNSVIGKIHRLRAKARGTKDELATRKAFHLTPEQRRERKRERNRLYREKHRGEDVKPRRRKLSPPTAKARNEAFDPGDRVTIGLMDLHPTTCRWPYDTPEGTRYCGRLCDPKTPYCAEHTAISLSPAALAEEDAA